MSSPRPNFTNPLNKRQLSEIETVTEELDSLLRESGLATNPEIFKQIEHLCKALKSAQTLLQDMEEIDGPTTLANFKQRLQMASLSLCTDVLLRSDRNRSESRVFAWFRANFERSVNDLRKIVDDQMSFVEFDTQQPMDFRKLEEVVLVLSDMKSWDRTTRIPGVRMEKVCLRFQRTEGVNVLKLYVDFWDGTVDYSSIESFYSVGRAVQRMIENEQINFDADSVCWLLQLYVWRFNRISRDIQRCEKCMQISYISADCQKCPRCSPNQVDTLSAACVLAEFALRCAHRDRMRRAIRAMYLQHLIRRKQIKNLVVDVLYGCDETDPAFKNASLILSRTGLLGPDTFFVDPVRHAWAFKNGLTIPDTSVKIVGVRIQFDLPRNCARITILYENLTGRSTITVSEVRTNFTLDAAAAPGCLVTQYRKNPLQATFLQMSEILPALNSRIYCVKACSECKGVSFADEPVRGDVCRNCASRKPDRSRRPVKEDMEAWEKAEAEANENAEKLIAEEEAAALKRNQPKKKKKKKKKQSPEKHSVPESEQQAAPTEELVPDYLDSETGSQAESSDPVGCPGEQESLEYSCDRNYVDITCEVCWDGPKMIANFPCGHITSCASCSEKEINCAVCRRQIDKRQRIYFA
jgi:hypothetical protein